MTDPGPKLMRGLLDAFVLERLEIEPKHGYALLKDMEERFGVAPNRNKLYPLLAKFEEDGLVAREEDPGQRGRTLYSLTPAGRAALAEYRRVTLPFRESVARLWSPEPAPAAPAEAAPRTLVPAAARAPSAADAPYPCPDARAELTKDPRTGDLSLRLTGCPMGAYEYCPLCPVHQAVGGLRRLLLG